MKIDLAVKAEITDVSGQYEVDKEAEIIEKASLTVRQNLIIKIGDKEIVKKVYNTVVISWLRLIKRKAKSKH